MEKSLDSQTLVIIICGIVMGTAARIITLRVDTRQNPSYPNGSFINIVMGVIAAALGSVAIPALLAGEFTAITFITLAVQHFREVRKTEHESLEKLEKTEYSKRGPAYIDGIAKTYESRNYISLITAFAVVLVLTVLSVKNMALNALVALITGLITVWLLQRLTKGKRIGDICTVRQGIITIDHSDLLVDGLYVTNVLGTQRSRDLFMNEGVAFVLEPKKEKYRLTIENAGQRQAMLFEATRTFGVKRFAFSKRSFRHGKLILAFVPIIRNPEAIMRVIRETPVLESSRKIHRIMNADMMGGE